MSDIDFSHQIREADMTSLSVICQASGQPYSTIIHPVPNSVSENNDKIVQHYQIMSPDALHLHPISYFCILSDTLPLSLITTDCYEREKTTT